MWIAICAVAVLVLVAASYAGLGELGQMPASGIVDKPRGIVPDGEVDGEFLETVSLPRVWFGYDTAQVDAYLAEVAAKTAGPSAEVQFPVKWGGYDMQVVDEVLARPRESDLLMADLPAD